MIKRQSRAELGCLTGMFFLGAIAFLGLQRAHQLSPVSGGCGLWFIAEVGMTALAALFGATIGLAAGAVSSLGKSVLVGTMMPVLAMMPMVVMTIWIGEPVVRLLQSTCMLTIAGGLCAMVSHVVAGMCGRPLPPEEDDDVDVVHPVDR